MAADRQPHQPRHLAHQRIGVDAELLQSAHPRGFDDDAGASDEIDQRRPLPVVGKIDRDIRLALVEEVEQSRIDAAHGVGAAPAFDLHHCRTREPQQIAGKRAGPDRREVDDERRAVPALLPLRPGFEHFKRRGHGLFVDTRHRQAQRPAGLEQAITIEPGDRSGNRCAVMDVEEFVAEQGGKIVAVGRPRDGEREPAPVAGAVEPAGARSGRDLAAYRKTSQRRAFAQQRRARDTGKRACAGFGLELAQPALGPA